MRLKAGASEYKLIFPELFELSLLLSSEVSDSVA